jgi:hypothetical protein
MEVSQLHTLAALLQGSNSDTHIPSSMSLRDGLDVKDKRYIFPIRVSNPGSSSLCSSHYTDYAIPAPTGPQHYN